MELILLWILLLLSFLNLLFSFFLNRRSTASNEEEKIEPVIREEFRLSREDSTRSAKELREEVVMNLSSTTGSISKLFVELGKEQSSRLDDIAKRTEIIRNAVDQKLTDILEEFRKSSQSLREELTNSVATLSNNNLKALGELGKGQQSHLEGVTKQIKDLTDSLQTRTEALRLTVDQQLKGLQEGNEKKLEEMRKTVDEKLHTTLEKRLGDSFKLVSERLEAVQKGLGEMQSLATGVGDLKKVLSNVKTRGTLGEVQLQAILEQILIPDQYDSNVKTKEGSNDLVEFAVRLPGLNGNSSKPVWLPIDSKFPQEDYLRFYHAVEAGDRDAADTANAALVRAIKSSAADIRSKYVDPPNTTDFGIMFLPTEGLYAEILRQPGLFEELLGVHRIVVAGPTTLAAILSSLRMGFRTLAIEERAGEIRTILTAVKTEFGKFGTVIDKVKKQLDTASRSMEETSKRSRIMERKLQAVEEAPLDAAATLLGLPPVSSYDGADNQTAKGLQEHDDN